MEIKEYHRYNSKCIYLRWEKAKWFIGETKRWIQHKSDYNKFNEAPSENILA